MANTNPVPAICKRATSKGFTLIEVLVALTIIAIALGALISTSGSQASRAAYLKQKSIAHWVAVNEITQLQVQKSWLDIGSKDGTTAMAGTDWLWTVTVKETEDADARQVEYKIYLDEDRKSSITSLTAYLTRPEPQTTTVQQP